MSSQVWWFTARASGITAWALVTASVLWGMALSTRALGSRPKGPWLTDLHRFLGGLAVVFTVVHMVALWADSYVSFGPSELLVPFASTWQPAAVAAGVVAFYLLVAVEVTSLLVKRLPKVWWKRVHVTSYVLYALATAHLLTAGTDAENPWLWWATWASVGAVAFFTTYLAVGPARRARTIPPRPGGEASRSGTAPARSS
jgi:DMSO/TMAO reductase YedYZ heme-binding membrane subunit